MKRALKWLVTGVVTLVVIGLGTVKLLYGMGTPYPDISTAPVLSDDRLTKIVELQYPPGNVAASADGRIFFNYHPFAQAQRFEPATLFELRDGKPQAFPNADYQKSLQGVFGLTVDKQNRLWLIEPAGLDHQQTILRGIDLAKNEEMFQFKFPPKTLGFAQDLRVSPDGTTIYLADTGLFKFTSPSIIKFDIASKTFETLIGDTPETRPQDWVIRTPFGPHKLGYGLVTFSVGVDGIEVSPDGEWLYFGSMSHDTLYRLSLKSKDAKPEAIGKKPLSDGITLDPQGRALITDIENGGIARMDASGKLETLVKNSKIVWADGIVVQGNRALFTDSAIPAYIDQLARPPSAEKLAAGRPYVIYAVTLD
jgi:sugar lactone lactonase YvrE